MGHWDLWVGRFLTVVLLGILCSLAAHAAEVAEPGNADATRIETRIDDEVQSDGAFRYSVPIRIPEFRGLEPKLGFSYLSSFKGTGSAEATMGPGWRLGGLSSIELASEHGGAPLLDSGSIDGTLHIYRLDGEVLLACDSGDGVTASPYGGLYPNRFKTTNGSGSCRAGGQFVTERDNGQRITIQTEDFNGQTGLPIFTVTRKDGTKYIYRSAGVLGGAGVAPSDSRHLVAFRTRFLLWRIQDLQATPNHITFEYAFSTVAEGYTPRVTKIDYGSGGNANGYNVQFHYDQPSQPMASFATGHADVLGRQNHRLRAVSVHDGSSPIRPAG